MEKWDEEDGAPAPSARSGGESAGEVIWVNAEVDAPEILRLWAPGPLRWRAKGEAVAEPYPPRSDAPYRAAEEAEWEEEVEIDLACARGLFNAMADNGDRGRSGCTVAEKRVLVVRSVL